MASQETHDDIVKLTSAANPMEAHLFQQVLADDGIKSQVVGDFLDSGIGNIPGVQAEVWVHRDDIERAAKALERHRDGSSDQ
jgi:hypothetical protein